MRRLLNALLTLFICCMSLIIYVSIHEGAHALFAVLFGGTLTNFDINILNGFPHVQWAGDMSSTERAFISIAGPLVPYVLLLAGFFFVHKESNIMIRKTASFASIMILGSMLPNIILPVLYENGVDVSDEDIVQFASGMQMSGYMVSLIMVLLFILLFILVFKKRLLASLQYQVDINLKNKRNIVWIVAAILILSGVLIAAAVNIIVKSGSSYQTYLPGEYDQQLDINLEQMDEPDKVIYDFTVETPTLYSFTVTGNAKEEITIKVKGSARIGSLRTNELTICSAKGNLSANYINWLLEKGTYQIILNGRNNKGKVKVYIKESAADSNLLNSNGEDVKILNGEIPQPDPGFTLKAKEKLSDGSDKNIFEFSLDEDRNVFFSIFLTTKQGKATVTLAGDDYEDILISEDQIKTDLRGCYLKKGNYRVLISSSDCDGEIYLYYKE